MAQSALDNGDRVPDTPQRGSLDPTMLKVLLRERHWQNYTLFTRAYQNAAKGLGKDLVNTYPSLSTFRRWLAGQVQDLPHAEHCTVLEAMLPGWTATELFQPPHPPDGATGSILLRDLLQRHHLHHYRQFCRAYDITAATIDQSLVGTHPTEPQFHQWIRGQTSGPSHPGHRSVLEAMFPAHSTQQLFTITEPPVVEITEPPEPASPVEPVTTTPHGRPEMSGAAGLMLPGQALASVVTAQTALVLPDHVAESLLRHNGVVTARSTARTDREAQVIAMSADKARDFLTRIQATNVGAETLDQLLDDVRRLIVASQQQPLNTWLGDLVDTQDRSFTLLEGHQRLEQSRDLYLVAGIACGLMALASMELGAFHDAMTQARAGYACADNAGHDGLRVWIRGLQAGHTYWAGRWEDSVHYARLGAEAAARSRGTASVWLASAEARALAALNRLDEAHAALILAAETRDRVEPDELDSLGGICTFGRPRQLYFAADALSWGGQPEAIRAERVALEALDAYALAPAQERSFGHEAGTRSALAVARVFQREIEGAADALTPVLALPTAQRGHGIVVSVERVRTALSSIKNAGRGVIELADAIEAFTAERLALPN